ncbi:hypothetical protein PVL29_022934 [Vitis rotundifolia]|uniref:Elongation factor 1-beta n=1 Tax=Vitis rotundifolia TaxID=103349 RepID=A0AA38YX89_VITRO|nr:hypothetical protein PVL29_022934 [Vitis rotundifolia]
MENFHHTSWVYRPLFWEPLLNTFLESCYMDLLPSFSLHSSHRSFLICPLLSTSSLLVVKLLCFVAITFSDLHIEASLKSLDEFLSRKAYIVGDHLTKDDVKVYARCISLHLAKSFPRKAIGVRVGCQAALVEAASKEVKEATLAGDDDDDLDLFGDEIEEEKKAVEEREVAVKVFSKKKESGKSSVFLDVKPWDGNTCLEESNEEHTFFDLCAWVLCVMVDQNHANVQLNRCLAYSFTSMLHTLFDTPFRRIVVTSALFIVGT